MEPRLYETCERVTRRGQDIVEEALFGQVLVVDGLLNLGVLWHFHFSRNQALTL